jgi:hypothetical protein
MTPEWKRSVDARLKALGKTRVWLAQQLGTGKSTVTQMLGPRQTASVHVDATCDVMSIPPPVLGVAVGIEEEAVAIAPRTIGPIPPASGDHPSDDVLTAFIGWASARNDDDMIAAACWPDEYKFSCRPEATVDDRTRLLDRVKQRRSRYEEWRDGRPFKAWMLTGPMTEKA